MEFSFCGAELKMEEEGGSRLPLHKFVRSWIEGEKAEELRIWKKKTKKKKEEAKSYSDSFFADSSTGPERAINKEK